MSHNELMVFAAVGWFLAGVTAAWNGYLSSKLHVLQKAFMNMARAKPPEQGVMGAGAIGTRPRA